MFVIRFRCVCVCVCKTYTTDVFHMCSYVMKLYVMHCRIYSLSVVMCDVSVKLYVMCNQIFVKVNC